MLTDIESWDETMARIQETLPIDFLGTKILESALLYLVLYGLAKYVFLEPMIKGKKAKIYYIVTFVIGVGTTPFFDELSQFLILSSLFIAMIKGRKKHRFVLFLQLIPWLGLSDGFMIPLIMLPSRFLENEPYKAAVYRSIAYSVIAVLFVCFLVFGKNWRAQFEEEVANRSLNKWERILLCVIGTLLSVFSALISMPLDELTLQNTHKTMIAFMGTWVSVACFVMDLTVVITVLIANKQAYYHNKVSDMQFNIIVMMAEIVENRDENTGGHIQRTAKYVDIIAKELKKEGQFKDVLTDEYINDMRVAAPLHDIGKIHVSDVILNKPGRLNEEEFQIMKTHAEEGRKLLTHAKEHLGNFSYLDVAVQMAGYHHEWWDGSAKGYPDQIKGEDIPLCARIMAVADVFDALTSRRCYKEPMPVEKAYAIIKEERGTHFDEAVVDAFFAASEQVEEALDKFLEDGDQHCLGHTEMAC